MEFKCSPELSYLNRYFSEQDRIPLTLWPIPYIMDPVWSVSVIGKRRVSGSLSKGKPKNTLLCSLVMVSCLLMFICLMSGCDGSDSSTAQPASASPTQTSTAATLYSPATTMYAVHNVIVYSSPG